MIVSWLGVRLATQLVLLAELWKKGTQFINRNTGGFRLDDVLELTLQHIPFCNTQGGFVSTMCSLACKKSLLKG